MYLSMLFVCSQKSPVDIAIKAAEKDSRQNISFSPRKSLPVFLRALMINRFLETFAQRHPGMQVKRRMSNKELLTQHLLPFHVMVSFSGLLVKEWCLIYCSTILFFNVQRNFLPFREIGKQVLIANPHPNRCAALDLHHPLSTKHFGRARTLVGKASKGTSFYFKSLCKTKGSCSNHVMNVSKSTGSVRTPN